MAHGVELKANSPPRRAPVAAEEPPARHSNADARAGKPSSLGCPHPECPRLLLPAHGDLPSPLEAPRGPVLRPLPRQA